MIQLQIIIFNFFTYALMNLRRNCFAVCCKVWPLSINYIATYILDSRYGPMSQVREH